MTFYRLNTKVELCPTKFMSCHAMSLSNRFFNVTVVGRKRKLTRKPTKTRHMREYKHSLTFRVRRYVIMASSKPVRRLQICLIVHNYGAPHTIPPSYISVSAVMRECGEGQTDRRLWPQYILRRLRLRRNVITP